jgi:hypothetical protein
VLPGWDAAREAEVAKLEEEFLANRRRQRDRRRQRGRLPDALRGRQAAWMESETLAALHDKKKTTLRSIFCVEVMLKHWPELSDRTRVQMAGIFRRESPGISHSVLRSLMATAEAAAALETLLRKRHRALNKHIFDVEAGEALEELKRLVWKGRRSGTEELLSGFEQLRFESMLRRCGEHFLLIPTSAVELIEVCARFADAVTKTQFSPKFESGDADWAKIPLARLEIHLVNNFILGRVED